MHHSLRTIIGFLPLLSLVACGNSDGDTTDVTVSATEADYDDVAQSLAVTVASTNGGGEVGSLSDSVSLAVGLPPLDLQLKASGEYAGIRAGLSYEYDVSCKDEQGQLLGACGLTTDSATAQVTWSGELALPNFAAAATRSGQWQIAGVKSGTAEFSGNGQFSFDATFQSSFRSIERHWSLDYAARHSGVRVQLLPRQVIAGTIHFDVTAERQASSDGGESAARFAMSGDVSFSATGAALVLDGTHSYAVDVNTGAVTRRGR